MWHFGLAPKELIKKDELGATFDLKKIRHFGHPHKPMNKKALEIKFATLHKEKEFTIIIPFKN